jgi:hypothetical protein
MPGFGFVSLRLFTSKETLAQLQEILAKTERLNMEKPMNFILVALIALVTAYGIFQAVSVTWHNRKPVQSAGSADATLPEMDFGPASNGLLSNPSAADVCEAAADIAVQATCEAAPSAVGHAVETIAHAASHFFHH